MSHHAKEREKRQNSEIGRERSCRHPVRTARIVGREARKASPLRILHMPSFQTRGFIFLSIGSLYTKKRCEITIISFSRSICRGGGLAALIGVTGKPYPSCLSCHSHPIRPCGHLPLEGKAAIREYYLLKKGGEAATRALNQMKAK